jgi:tripartite-type tricarboxylate transporter receptor subunit TctC
MQGKILAALWAVLFGLGLPAGASAQPYPSRTITLLVPFPAGTTTDNVTRKLAEYIRSKTNVAAIVDNKPGADGNLGIQAGLRAPADGYTVLIIGNSTHGANVNTFKEAPYDPINDFNMIGGVMSIPMILSVKPDYPANTLQEFVAEAKRRAKPLQYGSGAASTRGASELLKARYGINKMEYIPYRGSPQVVADLLGGQFDFAFVDALNATSLILDGRLKGLAVTSGKRLAAFPNMTTVTEVLVSDGRSGFELEAWVGVAVRAGTPSDVIEKLSALVQDFTKEPGTVSYLASMGSTPMQMDAKQLSEFVKSEVKLWAEIVEVGNFEKK